MKALILAAGKGTRLHPLTKDTPKPLVPLCGTRLLDRIINNLVDQGISEIAINSSHLSDEITRTYGNGNQLKAELLHSYEGYSQSGQLLSQPLGSAGGLKNIQNKFSFFDDSFVVLCGDAFFELDMWKAVEVHRRQRAVATVIVKEMPEATLSNYGVVNFNDDGWVRSFQEKPKAGQALSNRINTGIYIFSKEIFDYIPEGTEYDIGSQLLPDLVARGIPFNVSEMHGAWLDIGKIGDIHTATRAVLREETSIRPAKKRYRRHIWMSESANVQPARIVSDGELLVESCAVIEPGTVFQGTCTVGRNCVVRRGATLTDSLIIGSNIEVPQGLHLENKIVTDQLVISNDGSSMTHAEVGLLDTRSLPIDSSTVQIIRH